MMLPPSLTTVTRLSKTIALSLFIALPFLGFLLGMQYQEVIDFQNQQVTAPTTSNPAPTTQIQPIDTSNWKTYTNDVYKFSIRYPGELQIQERQFTDYKAVTLTSEYKPPFSNYLDIGLLLYTLNKQIPLRDWVNEYVIQELPNGKTGSIVSGDIRPYQIDGLNGLTFVGIIESVKKYIVFSKENNIFVFTLSGSGTGGSFKENPNGELTLDQILSTFKFFD